MLGTRETGARPRAIPHAAMGGALPGSCRSKKQPLRRLPIGVEIAGWVAEVGGKRGHFDRPLAGFTGEAAECLCAEKRRSPVYPQRSLMSLTRGDE